MQVIKIWRFQGLPGVDGYGCVPCIRGATSETEQKNHCQLKQKSLYYWILRLLTKDTIKSYF